MLNGRLQLHGCSDVELLCVKVLNNWERRTNTSLNTSDREDAVAFLIAAAWEIAEFKFDPNRGVRFDSHVFPILAFRLVDWLRLDEGRTKWQFATHTYERPKTTVLSLDGPAYSGGDDGDTGRLGELVAVHDGGGPADPDEVLAGLIRDRDRERARDKQQLRQVPAQRAA